MVLVIDNYDSFTYDLVQYLGVAGVVTKVVRNDEIDVKGVVAEEPSGILLSPGPCTPSESGVCVPILEHALDGDLQGIPLFGVCLGHQAIGMVSGGVVQRAGRIVHGKSSKVSHDGKGILTDMPNPFRAVRYHSLIVTEESIPKGFVATSWAEDDNELMGMRHESLPIEGVQFHPESVLTESGMTMIENFVAQVRDYQASRAR
ncbi:MAG: aminodeoxychorismate/anthranilate synthase component II [Armatimonadota bacterium]